MKIKSDNIDRNTPNRRYLENAPNIKVIFNSFPSELINPLIAHLLGIFLY